MLNRSMRGFSPIQFAMLLFALVMYSAPAHAQKSPPTSCGENCFFQRMGERYFYYYVPPAARSGKTALVIDLHGRNMDNDPSDQPQAIHQMNGSGQRELAKQKGFVVVWPEGHLTDNGTTEVWDGLTCCDNTSGDVDVKFINDVLDFMTAPARGFNIDDGHIYATGVSAGGAMTNRLGCSVPRVKAIAPISDEYNKNNLAAAKDCKKVDVMEFRSTDDVWSCFYTPASDPRNNSNCRAAFETVDQTYDRLRDTNACQSPAGDFHNLNTQKYGSNVDIRSLPCNGFRTAQIKLENGSHVPYGGYPVAEIMWDATDGVFSMP